MKDVRDTRARQTSERRVAEEKRTVYQRAKEELLAWVPQTQVEISRLRTGLDAARTNGSTLTDAREGSNDWFETWRGSPIATKLAGAQAARAKLRTAAEEAVTQTTELERLLAQLMGDAEARPRAETLLQPIEQLLSFLGESYFTAAAAFEAQADVAESRLRERMPDLATLQRLEAEAVARRDYDEAARIQEQVRQATARGEQSIQPTPPPPTGPAPDLEVLQRQEAEAVARRDYDEAARIHEQIRQITVHGWTPILVMGTPITVVDVAALQQRETEAVGRRDWDEAARIRDQILAAGGGSSAA